MIGVVDLFKSMEIGGAVDDDLPAGDVGAHVVLRERQADREDESASFRKWNAAPFIAARRCPAGVALGERALARERGVDRICASLRPSSTSSFVASA
jgi:hypothetical protein